MGPLLHYVRVPRGSGSRHRIWNTSGFNMESTRAVTTAKVRSKPFSCNDTFVVTIVGLGKKCSHIIIFDFPEFCADENISVDICATQVDWFNYCYYLLFSANSAQMKISSLISLLYMLINISFISINYFLKFWADENIFIDICALLLRNTFARLQNLFTWTCAPIVLI